MKRNLSIVTVGGIIRSGSYIVQGLLVARLLGAENYGSYALALAIATVSFGIIDFRMADVVVKFLARFHKEESRHTRQFACFCFLAIEGLKGIFAFLVCCFAGWFGGNYVYTNPIIPTLVFWFSAHHLALTFNPTLTAIFRSFGNFSVIAWYDCAFGIGSVVIVTATAYLSKSLEHVAMAWASVGILGGLGKSITALVMFNNSIHPSKILEFLPRAKTILPWREIFSFGWNLNLNITVKVLTRGLDVLVLGYFVNPTLLGCYELAKRFRVLSAYITDPATTVLYPKYSELVEKKEYALLRKLYLRTCKFAFFISAPLYTTMALSLTFLIPRVLGSSYSPAAEIFFYFLPESIVVGTFFSIYHLLLSLGKPRSVLKVSLIRLLVLSGLFAPGVFLLGAKGAALAVAIAGGIGTLVMHHIGMRELKNRKLENFVSERILPKVANE